MLRYLETPIVSAYRTTRPRYGMTARGYTIKAGAPTTIMIMLSGEEKYRRLMCWQFSNTGTLFVRVLGKAYIVREQRLPQVE